MSDTAAQSTPEPAQNEAADAELARREELQAEQAQPQQPEAPKARKGDTESSKAS